MAFQTSNLFRVSPPASVQTYFNKWLKESGGDFVVTHSDYTDRMMVSCKTCGDAHTCKIPIGTAVDYSLQEFVKLHTHKGGHKDEPKQIGGWAAYKSPLEATSVTADFKHVSGAAPLIVYLDKDGNVVPAPSTPPKIAPPKPMPALKHKTGRKFRP